MARDTPLVKSDYLLQKFPGKGGWTYAVIPEIAQNKDNPFGWVTVRGSIDGYALKHYKLMPMGNGKLFLPVKASIRKQIRKEAGDTVHIVLFTDDRPLETPKEILDCFENEPPQRLSTFNTLTDGERKAYLDWIYSARTDDTMAKRILIMMNRLESGLRMHDREDEHKQTI